MERQSNNIASYPDKDRELYFRAYSGDLDAREQIILNSIPLVKKCVKMYLGKGLSYDDLYQEGCYGLLIALSHFDPTRNTKFSTYAVPWILKYIRKGIAEQSELLAVRLGEDAFYELQTYMEAVYFLSEKYDRKPSMDEIAAYTNMSLKKVHLYNSVVSYFKTPALSLDEDANIVGSNTSSLDRPVEDEVLRQIKPWDGCANLTKDEIEVLHRRLGYTETGERETFKEIAYALGTTIPVVTNTYRKAITKLRKCVDDL